MYPGLLVLTPDLASSVINYRSKNLGAAMQNAKSYNLSGALYPWTGYSLLDLI
jgi:trehalose/maltose hydrolase-like predicted phosphorylase